MGVTIHFEGRLRGSASYHRVLAVAQAFATRHGWASEPIDEAEATLLRVRDEQDWDYTGPTRGLALHPHDECDPLRLEFDRDLYVQEFVKTQFAPVETHVKVVELFRLVAPEFESLQVEDEGEYWETSDLKTLQQHVGTCLRVLEDELKARPDHHGPVRLPTGRIVDYMSRE
jgi:hypothetical protein